MILWSEYRRDYVLDSRLQALSQIKAENASLGLPLSKGFRLWRGQGGALFCGFSSPRGNELHGKDPRPAED